MRIRRLAALGTAALATILSILGTASAAHAQDGRYYIRSHADNSQVFDDRAGSGTDLWTYQYHGGENQKWDLKSVVPGLVRIESVYSPGKCATATDTDSPVPLRDCGEGDTDAQIWQEHRVALNAVIFENVAFRDQCIALVRNNGSAELRTCEQVASQTWELSPVS